ncbi:MAG: hypothetical protein WB822_05965 [Rhodoplanes sp.]
MQAGRQRDVACVDGVLGVADEMGEADLMVGFSPAHLCAVAVGDPHGGTDVAEEVRDHVLAAAVANDEAAVFAVDRMLPRVIGGPGGEGIEECCTT